MTEARFVYVALEGRVWSFHRPEFRAFLGARANGIADGEGDPDRMGRPMKASMGKSSRSMRIRGGFPRSTDGHPRFDVTGWGPEQYRECLRTFDFSAGGCP